MVTGASSGIGEALARRLAARGHGLSLVARRADRLDALAAELEGRHGVEVRVHAADLTDAGDRAALLDALGDEGRAVAGLCNDAGTGSIGRFVDHPLEDELAIVRVNVLALHELTGRLLPGMVARGRGAVLNFSSVLAAAPAPHNATYAATKAFVSSFSEALHAELAGTGVSCTTVSPGPTRTPIWARSGAGEISGAGPGALWQEADEVARPAVDGMVAGRRSVVPGWTNKLAVAGGRYVPRTLLLPAAHRLGGERLQRLARALP